MLTPNQLLNVRRIMKEQRARRREAANRASDRRDAAHMDICARARRDGMRPIEHAVGYSTACDHVLAVMEG